MSDGLVVQCGVWRIEFFRAGDRYAHTIEAPGLARYSSVEGEGDPLWPSSPPFQELHRETRGEAEVILLVGRAGKSHWSASVELAPAQNRVTFDVACRVHRPPVWLGATYRGPSAASVVKAEEATVESREDALIIQSTSIPSDSRAIVRWRLPATVRWRYWFEAPGSS